jgi:hypothetical protein
MTVSVHIVVRRARCIGAKCPFATRKIVTDSLRALDDHRLMNENVSVQDERN